MASTASGFRVRQGLLKSWEHGQDAARSESGRDTDQTQDIAGESEALAHLLTGGACRGSALPGASQ